MNTITVPESANSAAVAVFKQTVALAAKNLSIPPESLAEREKLLSQLDTITVVNSQAEQDAAMAVIMSSKKTLKDVEAVRVELKDPVNELASAIQKLARDFSAPLQTKLETKLRLIADFQSREAERVREEERKRQAAIQAALRLEEENKRKLAAAQAAEAAAAAARAAEEARQAAEAARLAEAAKAAGQPVPPAPVTADGESPADVAAVVAAIETETAAAAVAESSAAVVAVFQAPEPEKAKSKGLVSRKVWKHRIVNASKAYAAHPEFFTLTPKLQVITSSKSSNPELECDGIEFWEEAVANVRV